MKFVEVEGNINTSLPLIYLWEVVNPDEEVCYRYVGKASGGAGRPRRHYRRNVNKLLLGRPYRKSKPDGFRSVHHHLAEAVTQGLTLRLSFICNVAQHENINDVERNWQVYYGLF